MDIFLYTIIGVMTFGFFVADIGMSSENLTVISRIRVFVFTVVFIAIPVAIMWPLPVGVALGIEYNKYQSRGE